VGDDDEEEEEEENNTAYNFINPLNKKIIGSVADQCMLPFLSLIVTICHPEGFKKGRRGVQSPLFFSLPSSPLLCPSGSTGLA
jgi:hypothetical protein